MLGTRKPKAPREQKLGRRKPVKRRSRKYSVVKHLDDLCREVVMRRDLRRCQLAKAGIGPCGGHLQACHIYGKGAHPSMRWEPENVIAGCWRHHAPQSPASWHSNVMDYADWFRATYPERAERLRNMSIETAGEKPDHEAIRLRLEEILR